MLKLSCFIGLAILGAVSMKPGQSATVSSMATPLLLNNSFEEVGSSGSSTSFTGQMFGGTSAAKNWSVWNNEFGTTTTELLPSTLSILSISGESIGGDKMIHVDTTGFGNGLFQVFFPLGTSLETARSSAWLYILRGKVGIGTGNGGYTGLNTRTLTKNKWVKLKAENSVSLSNEFVIYSVSQGGAEFYVDVASVDAVTEPVPEPLTILGSATALGFGFLLKREAFNN